MLTLIVTALIPLALGLAAAQGTRRLHELQARQKASLETQERVQRNARRDSLLKDLGGATKPVHLELLWAEITEYPGAEGKLLQTAFRANPTVPLPGSSSSSIRVDERLDSQAVRDYIRGLEVRYSGPRDFRSFAGLTEFLEFAVQSGASPSSGDLDDVARLVTGLCAIAQRPWHGFFRELVGRVPGIAGSLLYRLEDVPPSAAGGLRLNVLTGVLLASVDAEEGRNLAWPHANADTLRSSLPNPLAQLMHRDNVRSLDRWNRDGSTEPVSATVAWLIRVVGWLADTDDHLAMRMIENLAGAIRSVPEADRGWGIDNRQVQAGFAAIKAKQPQLWQHFGPDLQEAADEIGSWRTRAAIE